MNGSNYNLGSQLQIWMITLRNRRCGQGRMNTRCVIQESGHNLYFGVYQHVKEKIKDIALLKVIRDFIPFISMRASSVIHLITKSQRIISYFQRPQTLVWQATSLWYDIIVLLQWKNIQLCLEDLQASRQDTILCNTHFPTSMLIDKWYLHDVYI